jgi:hypothetical protein
MRKIQALFLGSIFNDSVSTTAQKTEIYSNQLSEYDKAFHCITTNNICLLKFFLKK